MTKTNAAPATGPRNAPTKKPVSQSARPGRKLTPPKTAVDAPGALPNAPVGLSEAHAAAPKGKLGQMVDLLRRPKGAPITELAAATGWQVHSVRGAISGSLKKKFGLKVISTKTEAGRTYRIVDEATA